LAVDHYPIAGLSAPFNHLLGPLYGLILRVVPRGTVFIVESYKHGFPFCPLSGNRLSASSTNMDGLFSQSKICFFSCLVNPQGGGKRKA
jgi:hypothetical protein